MPISHRSVSAARFGALGFAAVAFGCAAAAAILVGRMLTAKGYTGERVRPIVVAKVDLSAAQPISRDSLELRNWPEGSVPSGAFSTIDALFSAVSTDTNANPVPTAGILAGEPVVKSRLSTSSAGTGVARLVHPNMRAVALKVDDAIGNTSLVYPGASVDIIVTIRDPQGRGPSSRIAVQNARVLTVGRDTDVATRRHRENDDKRGSVSSTTSTGRTFVTLEVTPEEAEILSIARNEGKLNLALRNGGDDEIVRTAGSTPLAFSAFAAVEARSAKTKAAVEPAPDPEPEQRSSRRSRRSRRIEITPRNQTDEPVERSSGKPPGQIETYRAR